MDRSDSGFDASYRSKAPTSKPSVRRSSTASPRTRKSSRASPGSEKHPRSVDTNVSRTQSERGLKGPRRQSLAPSSSENSTKSRERGYGSKPSSRRTSCTMIDPARPARHYRINSTPAVPGVNRDIDDVIALHFRSCNLFQTPTKSSNVVSDVNVPESAMERKPSEGHTAPVPQSKVDDISISISSTQQKGSAEIVTTIEEDISTMHWMSPSTRRDQYEKMDKANNGIRYLIRKVVPRAISGPPPPRFFQEDNSEVGSVRRYRMDLSEEDDEKIDEKHTPLRHQHRTLTRARPKTADLESKTKRWGCF